MIETLTADLGVAGEAPVTLLRRAPLRLRPYPASDGARRVGYRRLLADPPPRQESSMRTHPWEVDDALWARVQP
ncbi:MAG TPA: hypothetical protein VLW53_07085, partial [Candidatus Eisenbacteria bacterium]|nr:hypothetical protein [Candidatus Eisenbacteria bacterium]